MKLDPHNTQLRCINIEPTLNCNLDCIMCPRSKFSWLKSKKNLNLDLFYKIVEDFNKLDFPKYYLLVGLGEPLLNKDFFKMVEYINKKEGDVDIVLHTNGTLLTEETIDKLLNSKLTEINFSINTASEESYNFITSKNFYNDISKKIINFLKRKKELKRKMRIFLQYIENEHFTIEQFQKEWGGYQDDDTQIYFKQLNKFGGEIGMDKILREIPKGSGKRRPCFWLWRDIHIDCDGNVYPCCQGNVFRDKSNLCLGSAKEGIAKIIESEKLKKFRQLHLEERWDEISECKNCNLWDGKPWFFKKTSGKWTISQT